MPDAEADDHLDELGRLADTAGAIIVDTLRQRLGTRHPKYYIGEGKVAELAERVRTSGATLVIFDEELSPAQGKNLEDALETRVVDRAELILDIFATRARSSEAQMQVELAQLQYMLPRLRRMWTHLSRIQGGIGFRGPGETQLETDRRLIGRRIKDLKRKLELVERQRATQRKGRAGELQAVLAGYTNAGKSSLLRALSGADVFIEDRLFATLDPSTRTVPLGAGMQVLVTDTVGFIRRLPHHLVASFRATLEEATRADILLHVIDASHPTWSEQQAVAERVLADLGVLAESTYLVFNKMDRLTHAEERALRRRATTLHPGRAVFVSALTDGGRDELIELLRSLLQARRPEVRLEIPSIDGEALAAVYREGEVLRREENGSTIGLIVRLPDAMVGRLRQRTGIVVSEA